MAKKPVPLLAPELLAPQPVEPVRQFSFTDFQVNNPVPPPPGDRLDGEFDRTNVVLGDTIDWAATSLNTDGTLRPGSVGEQQLKPGLLDGLTDGAVAELQPLVEQVGSFATEVFNAVQAASAAAVLSRASASLADQKASDAAIFAERMERAAKGAEDDVRSTSSDADRAENAANHADGSEAVAQAYADVGMAWAEHMPDTIPPNILAVMGVTGDHWSSRWWANQAAMTLATVAGLYLGPHPTPPATMPGGGALVVGALYYDTLSNQMFIWTGTAWVVFNGYLPLTGGTVNGRTTFQAPTSTNNYLRSAPTHPNADYVHNYAQLHSQYTAAATANDAVEGGTVYNAQFYTSIYGAPNTYLFNVNAVVDYNGTGGHGQHVAVNALGIRRTQNAGGAPNNPEIWGAVIGCADYTNTDSALTNTLNAIEIDLAAGNTDSAHSRRGIGMYLNQGNAGDVAPTWDRAVEIMTNVGNFNKVINLASRFNIAGIDFRSSTQVGASHAIWFADGHTIAFNAAGTMTLGGTSGVLVSSASMQIGGFGIAYPGLPGGGAVVGFAWTGTELQSWINGTNVGSVASKGYVDGFLPLAGGAMTNGLSFGGATVTANNDLTRHLALYAGYAGFNVTANRLNYTVGPAGAHVWNVNGTDVCTINLTGVTTSGAVLIGGASGPSWTTGSAAPSGTQPVGSLYSRVGGAVGSTLYVSRGGGTWAAVAGV